MRSLAEQLTRPVRFRLGSEERQILFTHRALLIAEELTGADMLNGAVLVNASSSMFRALLYAALKSLGQEVSLAEVGKAMSRRLEEAKERVVEAWAASMPEPLDPEDLSAPEPSQYPTAKVEKRTWMGAWAVAREEHGLSSEEWLDMTPRMFEALRKLRLEEIQRQELMMGVVASTMANFSMAAPKKPIEPKAFMLHPVRIKIPDAPVDGDWIMTQMAKLKQ